jgi:class 3 adenylate cyclase/signal transduction histidine kinase
MSLFRAWAGLPVAIGAAALVVAAWRARRVAGLRAIRARAQGWRVVLALALLLAAVFAAALAAPEAAATWLAAGGLLGAGAAVLLAVRAGERAERAAAEAGLSERQIAEVLDALGDAVALLDDDDRVRAVNRRLCELLQLPVSSLVGRPAAIAVGVEMPMARADGPVVAEREVRRRDGDAVPVSLVLAQVAPLGRICVLKDLRKERRKQRQLEEAVRIAEQALRARNEFLALVSLELQDPLGEVVRGCQRVAQASDPDELRALARGLTTAADQFERAVLGLLDVGRLGGTAEGARVYHPAALLREVCDSLAFDAARGGTELQTEADARVPTSFYGREPQTRQVLELLAGYALRRAPRGRVVLTVEPVPGDKGAQQLLFSVRASGLSGPTLTSSQLGGPTELHEAIHGTAALDLVVSRLLVLSLGGRLSVDSSAGDAMTLRFTTLGASQATSRLPTLSEYAGEPGTDETWRQGPDGSRRLARLAGTPTPAQDPRLHGKVLIVDDSATSRELLAHQLRQQGHEVETAETAREALARVWQREFDIILLDVFLPDGDGVAVLDELRQKGVLDRVAVLMISAVDETTSVAACIERGADDYLAKPISPVVLRARIGACLEKQHLRERSKQQLAALAAESRRVRDLLHVLLPDAIAEELQATGSIAPRRHERVAVLFADVVGFTAYCDRNSPEQVLISLQELFSRFEALADRLGVQKIKTIGDSFMAAAGMFGQGERPVLRCVELARAMLASVAGLPLGWSLRIGVHVGPVVGGVVGTRQYLYDIWGDTVNTAQRIESSGRPGAVCVSAEARDEIAGTYPVESLGTVTVKGKGELEIFQVLGGPP